MKIIFNTEDFLLQDTATVIEALEFLNEHTQQILFTVNEGKRLTGAFTDGNLRRYITSHPDVNIKSLLLKEVMTPLKEMNYGEESQSRQEIADMLSNKTKIIPIVDSNRRVTQIAVFETEEQINIGKDSIHAYSSAFLIAEIGNNHNGSLKQAKKLVDLAADAGADCVKFQMRDLSSLYSNKGKAGDIKEDLGSQYVLDLLSKFQLKHEEFIEVFDYCKKKNLAVLCTPFDEVSAMKLAQYGVDAFKIASADLTNHDLLRFVARFGKPMIVSTGMATENEIIEAISVLKKESAKYILLHCNSTYPAPFKDINLRYMLRLQELGGSLVGYSGHERDINVALAAVSLGAKVVEKHFTTDRTLEGNDHKVSLLPEEFAQMVKGVREIEQALGTSKPRTLSQGELMNRETLAKSVVAAKDIPRGTKITSEHLAIRSPGKGLAPYKKNLLVGKVIKRDLQEGDFFFDSDILTQGTAQEFDFPHDFGIPVRYHDVNTLGQRSNFRLLEFHLSYKDLDEDVDAFFKEKLPFQLVVHAPELFAGDHTLDLCSPDEEYRKHSIKELQRVIEVTRKLKKYFPKSKRPCIVCNVGGFSSQGFLDKEERKSRYAILEKSLKELDTDGVELIPQTMPPFPWHFGGQQYHNLFVKAEEIIGFCEKNNMRICFDISHSKLACNHEEIDFDSFVESLAPYTAHYHIADAQGTDGEGLQVGEGEIDFTKLMKQITEHSPDATWIPEIWQGHKNDGEGFWIALERLYEVSEKKE